MLKYRKITGISLVTDMISIYRKKPISKVPIWCWYWYIDIEDIYRRYFRYIDPPLVFCVFLPLDAYA